MQGGEVLCFEDHDFRLKFIESLFFMAMHLSYMPMALGFEDLTKGYFPHKFSSVENLKDAGNFAPPSNYAVERMSAVETSEFDAWYKEERCH